MACCARRVIEKTTTHKRDSFLTQSPEVYPTFYSSIAEEYTAITSSVALVDRSYLSKITVTGNDGLDFLHRISTNDLKDLKVGHSARTILTTEKGKVIDLVNLYLMEDSSILILSHAPPDLLKTWLDKFLIMEDVKLTDSTDRYKVFTSVGLKAIDLLELIGGDSKVLKELDRLIPIKLEGGTVVVGALENSRMKGYNLLVQDSEAAAVWDALLKVGRVHGLVACGSVAYEIHRIELGIPVYGCELTRETNPLELGLWEYISFTKGCYIGQEVIARLDTYDKVQRKLVGLTVETKDQIPSGAGVMVEGQAIGTVTSSSFSHSIGRTVCLALLRHHFSVPGSKVTVMLQREISAEVADLPFRRG